MSPSVSDPVVLEAAELRAERRRILRALASIDSGAHLAVTAEHLTDTESQRTSTGAQHVELQHDFAAIERDLAALLQHPDHGARIDRALDERAATLRLAARLRVDAHRSERLEADADAILASAVRAAHSGGVREVTRGESVRIATLRGAARDLREGRQPHAPGTAAPAASYDWRSGITTEQRRDAVLDALGAVRIREARGQLRDGLLRTSQMRGIISEALPGLRLGDPVLLIGETGGAKTALAEYLSRHGLGREPELVSGYGDITSAQVIGTHELRAEGGATVTVFTPGPLVRAMAEGRPVILDEVNAMPAEFLKRLNRILQLRPGDHLDVQEDAGRRVEIAPGFAIIATANEQTPHRYRGLDRLSAELVNRFGAHAYRVHYPDSGNDYADFPAENALLAVASVADQHGRLPQHVRVEALTRVARAAFISQQVFAGAHGTGFSDYVSSERSIDGRPGLEETVLAPRTLVAILRKVAGSAGAISLERALTRFVEGTMHREDRRVLALILEGQGFRLGGLSAGASGSRSR